MTIDAATTDSGTIRLDIPPHANARIALSPDFGRRFAIFADAEEQFDWNGPFRRDAVATSAMLALPEANARLVSAGCIPTYMVDWPIIDTPDSAAILKAVMDNDQCEIGTQLHPWVNPPFEEIVSDLNSYVGKPAPGAATGEAGCVDRSYRTGSRNPSRDISRGTIWRRA